MGSKNNIQGFKGSAVQGRSGPAKHSPLVPAPAFHGVLKNTPAAGWSDHSTTEQVLLSNPDRSLNPIVPVMRPRGCDEDAGIVPST
jgi:hypothetical protein